MATHIEEVQEQERALIGQERTPDDLPDVVKKALAAGTEQKFDNDGFEVFDG